MAWFPMNLLTSLRSSGKDKEAVRYYEKAESLFKKDSYKNMARAAINNIVIETLITEEKKKKK